jgi:TP901 family phage tail tape measure protein
MKKIGIEDLFKEIDIFKKIRESAEQTIQKLDQMHQSSQKVAQALNDALGKNKMDSSKSINELNKAQEKSNKLMLEAIKIENLKKQAEQQSLKVTQEIEKLEGQYQKRLQESAKVQREVSRAEQERLKAQREQMKVNDQIARDEEKKAKAQAKADKLARDEASAYKQLVKATRDLKNASKDLAVQLDILEQEGKQNTSQYQRLAQQYKVTTTEAQKYDARLKQIDASVGDHQRNVGNYVGALNTLKNGLAQVGIAFGFSQVVGRATQTLVKFDEESANISKTLGVTKEEARGLSMELTKIDTRTSVEALQQIAVIGGQLGIGKKDIVGFTESIDKLNVALGDEFSGGAEEITSVVGGLRNVFSDIKSENVSDDLLKIGNALNVLGAEGSATSPVMSDFAGRIGGVGIPLGLTTGQVLGLSATLQELNVSAERGGTAIGGILKKMAEDTEGFSKLAGMGASEFANLVNTDLMGAFMKVVEGTRQFNGNAVGLAQTLDGLKLDGAGASEVFLKLANNTDLLKQRTDSANKSLQQTDSITDEFNKKNETLQAKIDKLIKAFDVYVLGIDESGAVTGTFGVILDFLADNLGTIVTIVGKVVRAWLVYKTTMTTINTYNKLAEMGFSGIGKSIAKMIPFTRAYRLSQLQVARATQTMTLATNGANLSQKALKTTMMGTPWGLIAVAVTEVAFALYDYFGASQDAEEQASASALAEQERKEALEEEKAQQDELNKSVAEESREFVTLIEQLRNTNAGSDERLSLIKKINAEYGTTLKNLSDETAFQKQLNTAVEDYINLQYQKAVLKQSEGKFNKLIENRISKEQELVKWLQEVNQWEKENGATGKKSFEWIAKQSGFASLSAIKTKADFEKLQTSMQEMRKKGVIDWLDTRESAYAGTYQATGIFLSNIQSHVSAIERENDAMRTLTKDMNATATEVQDIMKKSTPNAPRTTPTTPTFNTTNVKEYNTELREVNDYLEEARQLLQDLLVIDQQRQVKQVTDDIEKIVEDAQNNIEKNEGVVLGVTLEAPKYDEEGVVIDEEKQREKNLQTLIDANTTLNQKIEERARLEKDIAKQRAEFDKETAELEMQVKLEDEKNKLIEERDKLLAQEGIGQADIDKINANYDQRVKELGVEEVQMKEDVRLKKLKIDEQYNDEVIKIDESVIENKKTENEKLLADYDDFNKKKLEKTKKATDDELDAIKKREQAIQELIKATSDYFIKKSEDKIAQLEKEIEKAEENQNALQELAKNGNISAKESLAENQKIIDEANKQKLREQKKQERIKLVEVALTTYSSKVEEGSKNPLADTIKDITLLTQLVNSLPAFEKGTEDTGANGRGVDGKGGFHAVLHPHERVIPKSLNEQIGNLSNEDLTRIASDYQNGKVFMKSDSQIGSALDTAILVQKLDNLTKVIENKPEHHFEIGQITQTFFEMIEKTKKGNTTNFNKYKVKR